jgi:hypothetical protein
LDFANASLCAPAGRIVPGRATPRTAIGSNVSPGVFVSGMSPRRESVELVRIDEIPGTAVFSLADDAHGRRFHVMAQLLTTEGRARALGEAVADGDEAWQRFELSSGDVVVLHYGTTTGTELFAEQRSEPALLALVERLQGMEWPSLKP